ncbi:DUF2946 family protein [Pelagovum pacificum]|uniref:DUF2946 domain-containing protein n=1 Tax=Pelagovum pacificum TaxID=2588711 RepID=A0A5C5GGF4_9RHOB|nr:DUF2946 family protein [Pelagovum pacificum]QQA44262.1 hypothetical protein I8N54_06695 [Pelagovum pacificum]TNY32616.1 hypothetical protein FHY64_04870 [Pelagovum pacificum]
MHKHETSARKRPGFARGLLRLLVCLPLLLIALLPPGTMPAVAADGSVYITICTGDGPILAVRKADGEIQPVDEVEPGHDSGSSGPCDWAVHSGPLAIAGENASLTFVAIDGRLDPLQLPAAAVLLADVLGPQARGPPDFS